jgi:hypothetical protein
MKKCNVDALRLSHATFWIVIAHSKSDVGYTALLVAIDHAFAMINPAAMLPAYVQALPPLVKALLAFVCI